ncbi:MAG: hypothetical protein JST16_01840 [Bdellovibrionales bacterium]|nr:hypothetical protein [Bdellovibrionales bacterium]
MNLVQRITELSQFPATLVPQKICCPFQAKSSKKRNTAVPVRVDLKHPRTALAVCPRLNEQTSEKPFLTGLKAALRAGLVHARMNRRQAPKHHVHARGE